jgi:hypothetical protein
MIFGRFATFRNIGPLNTNGAEAQPPHLLASLRKTAPGRSSKRCMQSGGGCGASTARVYCGGRGELVERSFALCYETGGMRRYHLRGRKHILKRQLLHVGAFNLSLIRRKWLEADTPSELTNRAGQVFSWLSFFLLALREVIWRIWLHPACAGSCKEPSRPCSTSDHHSRVLNTSATGC